jgi:hypothetical protein
MKGMIMYKPGGTVREALKRIEQNDFVLPAIQREFVGSVPKLLLSILYL